MNFAELNHGAYGRCSLTAAFRPQEQNTLARYGNHAVILCQLSLKRDPESTPEEGPLGSQVLGLSLLSIRYAL